MSENENRSGRGLETERTAEVASDRRLPYEPPRLLKKRSVAQATLFTAMTQTSTGFTMTG
jgi:hypothetical protein